MNIRNRAAAGILAASAAAGAFTLTGGAAYAKTPVCTTSNSHSHSVTAKGTVTDTWTTKHACGKDYTKAEHRVTQSYTGAHSDMQLTRNEMNYPHWTQHEVLVSTSKSGTVRITVTNTAG